MRALRFLLLMAPLAAACAPSTSVKISGASASDAVESTGAASGDLSSYRFKPKVCEGLDTHPTYALLDEKSLTKFLKDQGYDSSVERARSDLVYVDVVNAGTKEPVRLRVAILKSSAEAGNELHRAILEHGEGSWGVHRGNLAVLAPISTPDDAVAFAVKTKLACWGVFTIGGRDDTFVVAGGYSEL